MAHDRIDRVEGLLRELAATFLERETDHTSLITVTRCTVSRDLTRSTVFFTVLPDSMEEQASAFVTRRMGAFREYVKSKTSLRRLPYFEAEFDKGERIRQKIDSLDTDT
ncbi:MAG: hypothetical protein A2408_01155 [Candidatus Yonathbacteria bacterium RIFOXYC1_FULL_52_10]|uniref:Ribosome-binding factor A n=1 Tax=Candidatus Yonathbacteria bacterium RIFOXYD1_FULL_52_36 TaxID=1802730 RepID=A0A1G2SKI2_9BACT|nr:MAG: hypothetical protein A2408_01155 [Candidatus Yonathbacteria bacterium RIFOXYC1_FULL_52_10]OHA85577.1 MAG: hypothetical protein A2591_00210 [Candidatus Yonathbacteria bacterium RIFOXYD1_FULL_52_36]